MKNKLRKAEVRPLIICPQMTWYATLGDLDFIANSI